VSQSLRNKKNAQQENDSDEAIPADSKNELWSKDKIGLLNTHPTHHTVGIRH
jgi:hypothetical protein